MKALKVALLTVGGLAFAFQVIGCFSPGWIVVEFDILDQHYRGEIGLYFTRVCYQQDGENLCSSDSTVNDHVDFSTIEPDIGTAVLLLAPFGGLCCIFGCIITIEHIRRLQSSKLTIIASVIDWILSAVLVLIAVGLQADKNEQLKKPFDQSMDVSYSDSEINVTSYFKVGFPWAILMSGLGAMFAFINCILMTVVYCQYTPPEPVVGQWQEFTNTVVVQTHHSQSFGYPGYIQEGNHRQNMAHPFPVVGQGNHHQSMVHPFPVVGLGNHHQSMVHPFPVVEHGNQP